MPSGVNNLVLYSPAGVQLEPLYDYNSLQCTLIENHIGTLVVRMPPTHNDAIYQIDGRLAYYRAPTSENSLISPSLVGNCTWMIQKRRRVVNADGAQMIELTAVHPNHLLSRRIIPYDDGTSQAAKSGIADDVMKAIVKENFTAATDAARNWDASLFTVEADVGATTTVDWAGSYRTVLTVLQELSDQAMAAGFYCGFEVYSPTESGPYAFRTYYPQRGADHTSSSGQPIVLGIAYGSMAQTEVIEDYTGAASFVYATGRGTLDERLTATAQNDDIINGSPYGRREWLANASHSDNLAELGGAAGSALWAKRARRLFTGPVISTPAATFGEEYDFGDRVVGEFSAPIVWQGYSSGQIQYQFDCRVDPVRITVQRRENEESGAIEEVETLDIRLRNDEVGIG